MGKGLSFRSVEDAYLEAFAILSEENDIEEEAEYKRSWTW